MRAAAERRENLEERETGERGKQMPSSRSVHANVDQKQLAGCCTLHRVCLGRSFGQLHTGLCRVEQPAHVHSLGPASASRRVVAFLSSMGMS